MEVKLPFRRLLRLALITIPFFGIAGTTPIFIFPNFSLSKLVVVFTIVVFITSFIWGVNIFLLHLSARWNLWRGIWIRFFVSSFVSAALLFAGFTGLGDYIFPAHPAMPFPGSVPFSDLPPPEFLPPSKNAIVAFPIIQALSINVIVSVFIELFQLKELQNKIVLENEQLKTANLEAKINSLKEQLHPHFLFNSLSTLRSLISRSQESAEIYLEELSELLRFSISNSKAIIPLRDEVKLCTAYLSMQKVRFGEGLGFEINIPEEKMTNISVPVYSLQQLAENAIKHNIHTRENPLHIKVVYNGITNEILMINNLQTKQTNDVTHLGTGLANLNERYRLLGYNGIMIRNNGEKFTVAIQLIKNESSNN